MGPRKADKMVQRVTYRRRLSYNTKSNRRKIVRTPGGKLVFQYLKKRPQVPKCPMTGIRLKGVKPMRPSEKSRHSLRQKKVYRAYGGSSASCPSHGSGSAGSNHET